MSKAIILTQTGGPEVLKLASTTLPALQPTEVLISQTAIGLNYLDVHHRSGQRALELPSILGFEACGYVEEIGSNVTNLQAGDRVIYATAPGGAYCDKRVIDEKYLLGVPDNINDFQAAAITAKGLTAHLLLRRTYNVKPQDVILVHAAAGGVGSILCQWAKHLKAKVIGTVGNDEKMAVAKKNGCDFVINYRADNFLKKVMEYTNGQGVHVVYDSIGKDSFYDSVSCLMNFGLMVSYGSASGPIPPIDIQIFNKKSHFLTCPSLFVYKQNKMELVLSANEVYSLYSQNIIKDNIYKKYNLKDASQAHADFEQRKIIGSAILVP